MSNDQVEGGPNEEKDKSEGAAENRHKSTPDKDKSDKDSGKENTVLKNINDNTDEEKNE